MNDIKLFNQQMKNELLPAINDMQRDAIVDMQRDMRIEDSQLSRYNMPNLMSNKNSPSRNERAQGISKTITHVDTNTPNMASPAPLKLKQNPYFTGKKPSGRAGMQTRHPGISRRALGVHNTSCDINNLYENSNLVKAVQESDILQELTMSQDVSAIKHI